jgi:hypothetical protein
VPYATGEIPEVGDYLKNQWGQLGTVTRVRFAQNEGERICIRRDDEVGSAVCPYLRSDTFEEHDACDAEHATGKEH